MFAKSPGVFCPSLRFQALCRLSLGLLFLFLFLLLPVPQTQAETFTRERGDLPLTGTPQRIVALNWAATEALLLLGVTPVGMADRDGYPVWVREPALPEQVRNVGTRASPSLEAIAELGPDLIVTSDQLAPASELLESIAPTYVISVYDEGVAPFSQAREMLLALGEMVDRKDRALAVLAELERTADDSRRRLLQAGLADKPVALVMFMDERHVRINAPNGLLQAGLDQLGLTNAWQEPGNFWGFSLVGLEALAPLSEARLVAISPIPPGLDDQLAASPFWTHLPAVRNQEVYLIEPVWAYGGINAVNRLVRLLTTALLEGGQANVH